jgi:hypothetical protein
MAVECICEWCGFPSTDPAGDDVDFVQCCQCGELVVRLPPDSGLT